MCNVGITGLAQCVYVKHSFGRVGGWRLLQLAFWPFPLSWALWFWVSSLERAGGFNCYGRVQQEHLDSLLNSFDWSTETSVMQLLFQWCLCLLSVSIFLVCDAHNFLGSDNHVFGEVSTCWVTQSIGSAVTNKLCVETCDTGFRLLWVVLDTTC